MKHFSQKTALAIAVVGLSSLTLAGCTTTQTNTNNANLMVNASENQNAAPAAPGVTSQNCLADDCLLVDNLEYPVGTLPEAVSQALRKAIDDEYKARASYEAIIAKVGAKRPFSMIIRAEEQHISSLKSLFDKYNVAIPADPYTPSKLSVGATVAANCQIGVDAEIANAALYRDQLLPAVTAYADITQVFTSLMDASQDKHLPAFEKCN
jgi:hypothetical protein